MARSLTTLALLLAIVLGAALIVPAATNWEEQRASLEVRIAEVVGGPVALAGPVSVRLLPTPRLTAARVSFEDSDGRLRVEGASLHAEIALWPLFANQVVVTQVALEGGDMRLVGDAASLRALTDEMASAMSIGAGAFDYRLAPARIIVGENEEALVLEGAGLEAHWDGGDTPVRLTLRHGEDIRADVTLRPQADETWHINFRGTYRNELAVLSANGVLARFAPGASFDGDYSLVTDHARHVLGLEGEGPVLTLRGPFHAEGPNWSSVGAQLTLGTMQAEAELRGATDDAIALQGELNTALADLDLLGFEMIAVRDFLGAALLNDAPAPIPQWLDLGLTLRADGLVLNDRVARDVGFELQARGDATRLSHFSGRLPGGTNVTLAPRRDPARRLVVQSESVRNLVDWLGYDVTAFPPDKLQNLELDLAISEGRDPLRLSLIDLELDGGRAEGVHSIAPNGAAVSTLSFSNLDLDAYVPAAGGSFISRLRYYASLAGARASSEFNLTGEDVRLAGSAVNQFRFAGTTTEDTLLIQEAEMAFANGGSLSARGQWSGQGAPFELQVEGANADPGLFEGLPIAPSESADLSLQLARNEAGALTAEGNVRTQGLSIDIVGNQVSGNDEGNFQGRMIARGQEQGALARALGLEVFAGLDGAELLDLNWRGPLDHGELVARLELAGFSGLARGAAAHPFSEDPSADLRAEFTARSVGDLVRQVGGPELDALNLATLTGSGQLRRTEDGWRILTTDSVIGTMPVEADLVRTNEGIIAGSIGIAALEFQREDVTSDGEGTLAWSTTPYDLSWMETAAANLDVTVGALTLGELVFTDVGFLLIADDVSFTFSEARGGIGDGLLTGSAALARDDDALTLAVDLAGEGVPIKNIFRAAGLPDASGRLTVAAQLRSRGRSPFDLIAGLGGRLDVGTTDGAATSIDLVSLQDALPKVGTRRALRDAANVAVSQGTTTVPRMEGVIPIERGVMSLSNLSGIAETGPFTVAGAIDLRSDIIDVETTFEMTDAEYGTAPVTVAFRGAGGGLQTSIDISALQALIGERLVDTPQGLISEDDLPDDLRQLLEAYEAEFPDEGDTPAAVGSP